MHDPRYERRLSPEAVAAQVAEIFTEVLIAPDFANAERDAWATIEAARRLGPFGDAPALQHREEHPPSPPEHPSEEVGEPSELRQAIAELSAAVGSLSERVGGIESTINTRLDALLAALARDDGKTEGTPTRPPQERPASAGDARSDRVRAVDLTLRGFTRAQIAAELRGSLGEGELERLLDDVLEAA